jgi:hypothetical protein
MPFERCFARLKHAFGWDFYPRVVEFIVAATILEFLPQPIAHSEEVVGSDGHIAEVE